MSKEGKIKLSHVSFVVLGLVSEEPCHGKKINEKIEKRGMRNWTAIGKSSIYGVLKALKEKGLVNSWIEEEDNRVVKMYQITNKGFKILKSKVYKVLSEFMGKDDPSFYVAFSMIPILSQEELVEVFTKSLNTIKKHKGELEKMLEDMLKNFPRMQINVTGLFIHPIMILQTDIEFLELILKEIKEGKVQVDEKAHGK